ncbi:DUF4189 domain-containing protein [Nocardioides humilatus]|nr:DUF4189 domain-containing protein [Nocardioides humilatus]
MRSPHRLRAALTSAAVLLAAATALVAAPPASASAPSDQQRVIGCEAPRCFGAISFNKRTGVAGIANDKDGRPKSIRLAQRACRAKSERTYGSPGQCTEAGSVQNGCMAVAFRVLGDEIVQWQTEFGHTKREAKSAAHAAVAGEGSRYFAAWLCTTRNYS